MFSKQNKQRVFRVDYRSAASVLGETSRTSLITASV